MSTILESKKTLCYHCGDNARDADIICDDKPFCCHGCKTVYELLEKNDLCNYYSLGDNPGNQLSHFFSEKYNYLENEDISDLLLDFKSEKFHKVTFRIPTIHCSSCIWLLENLKRFDTGILSSQINFGRKKLTINFDPKETKLKKIVDLLCQLSYEPEISLGQNQKKKEVEPKTDMVKLGVAGFVFGNIMLLSFPEYFGIDPESLFTDYFAYFNLMLSLPVLIYCASEFYLSAFRSLSKKILNIDLPITIGIITLFGRSAYEILSSTGAGYLDSLAGLVFFLLIGRWFQSKTYEGLSFNRNFQSYFPLAVTKIQSGEKESVLVERLEIGDQLEIRNEEILPCDSVMLSETGMIDYSFVTGESLPVEVKRDDTIYAGGRVKGVAISVETVKIVSKSYLTQLWNNPALNSEKKEEKLKLIDRISQYFTPIVLSIAILAGAYWFFADSSKVVFVVSSVLIIACPCALALATPFTLGSVMNFLGSRNFYLKNTAVIEDLWRIKHLVFDKTGTITYNESNQVIFQGSALSTDEISIIYALANNSTHPISQQVYEYLTPCEISHNVDDFQEKKGEGISGKVAGKIVMLGSHKFIGSIGNSSELVGSVAHVSIDGKYIGCFTIKNQYRLGLKKVIENLESNYQFSILSGDNAAERSNLKSIFPKGTKFHFNQSPAQKLHVVQKIQATSPVMMLGDGLNDAGALGASDVGVSVAENVSAFTPASEAILLGASLIRLPEFLNLVRQSKKVILVGFFLSFAYNILGIGFAVLGYITPVFAAILMPLSSITVVAFSTLSIQFLGRKIKFD